MLTTKDFEKRAAALYSSQRSMAAAKKWKSGKRAGTVRKPASELHFNRMDLTKWLWKAIGLNAMPCPYCSKPIDIMTLTLDHIVPRSTGGEFSLSNMQVMCHDCNARKGDLTQEGFVRLLAFAGSSLSSYDRNVLLKRLKEANSGSSKRFFRDKTKSPAKVHSASEFSGLGEF